MIALLVFVSTGQIFSQDKFSVSGRVISALSREPVEYATVYVKGNEKYYSITDSTGFFIIKDVTNYLFAKYVRVAIGVKEIILKLECQS